MSRKRHRSGTPNRRPIRQNPAPGAETRAGGEPSAAVREAPVRRHRWRLPALLAVLVAAAAGGALWGVPKYLEQQAAVALAEGRFAESERLYQEAADWAPRNGDLTLGQARVARCQGDPSRARTLLDIAEQQDADASDVRRERILLKIQGGDAPLMVRELPQLLIEYADRGSEVFEAYAIGFSTAGNDAQALEFVNQWLKISPDDPRAYRNQARLLDLMDETEAAEQCYTRSLELDPNSVVTLRGLARVKMDLGKREEAMRLLQKLIDIEPDDIEARLLACGVMIDLHQDEQAIAELQTIIERDRDNFTARHLLATVLSDQGRSQEVIETVLPIMDEFPDDVSLQYQLATAYSDLGKTAQANAYLEQHLAGRRRLDELNDIAKQAESIDAPFETVLMLSQEYLKYQWDKAEPWLDRAIQMRPDSIATHRAMSDFFRKRGDRRRAAEYARAAEILATQNDR